MAELVELVITLGFPLLLLAVAWLGGRTLEGSIRRSLDVREKANGGILLTDLRSFPGGADPSVPSALVSDGVVFGVNYLRSFWGGIRKIFGGELKAYNQIAELAQREAVQRLLERAREAGFDAVCNIRFDSSDIGGSTGPKGVPMIVLFVSGTAYRRSRSG